MKQGPNTIMPNIARNIKQIRELKDYTQEYMAQLLGISQSAYVKIEQGVTVLKIDRLQQIADTYYTLPVSFMLLDWDTYK
ncbi:MAG: helix-turn-helix domain-containing protein [Dysgonamonadaceae bacterium]|jgi:transcriptional regulator with XRE-family HTH domain|nr:helix-turn-helix domain-containing protein [Dysgonamonadaceae bacterium]